MKNPVRITVAMDEETNALFDKLKTETKLSQSELLRRALKFYSENKGMLESVDSKTLATYVEMLAQGEHMILDVDHWLLFLRFLESAKDKEKFWENHRLVAKSHAEQFSRKHLSLREVLERLEACNFYKLNKTSEHEFALVLSSDTTKQFVKLFLEEVFAGMGFKTEIKEDFAKLRVKVEKA